MQLIVFPKLRRIAWSTATLLGSFALAVYLLGSLLILLRQCVFANRFRRVVRGNSYTSRIWQQRAVALATQMGIAGCPEVRLVRAAISPMLWGVGQQAVILLPDRLLEQLDHRGQSAVLAHELAHFQRGDHWVRLAEAVALIAFWWHPVFWWLRHEIEVAEEQCCDAEAVRQVFGDRRGYAEALLATVDFVHKAVLPPMACGAYNNAVLRARLRQIMAAPTATVQARFGPCVVALVLFCLLPFPTVFRNSPTAIQLQPPQHRQRTDHAVSRPIASYFLMNSVART